MTTRYAPTIDAPVAGRIAICRALLIDLGVIAALLIVTFWRLLPAIDETPFHRDEARWIGNAAVLREWRDPLGERWQDEGYPVEYGSLDEKNRRRSQPPLAMYFIGGGLLLQGHGLPSLGYWIMDRDTEWNIDQGNMPSAEVLHAARRTSVVAAGLTVVALFALGRRITNRVGGIATALIYAVHPLVLDTSARAWSDPLLALCIVLAALAAGRLAVRPTWGRAALVGLLLGLGGATKLSPLGVAVGLGGLGLVLLAWTLLWNNGSATRLRQLGVRLVAVPFVAFAVFVAVYPYLWTDPIAHMRRMIDFRAESFELQGAAFPPAKVADRTDAFRRVGVELGERFSTSGLIAEQLEGHAGFGDWTWLRDLDLMLASAGWLLIIAFVVRRGAADPAMLIAAVIGGAALSIILTMGVEYARYLLPVLLAVAVGAGVSCSVLWDCGITLVGRRRLSGAERPLPR